MESNKDGFTIQDIEISCEPRNENIINNNEINLLCKCTLKITLSHNQETPVEKQIRFCINSAPTFELYSYDYGDENMKINDVDKATQSYLFLLQTEIEKRDSRNDELCRALSAMIGYHFIKNHRFIKNNDWVQYVKEENFQKYQGIINIASKEPQETPAQNSSRPNIVKSNKEKQGKNPDNKPWWQKLCFCIDFDKKSKDMDNNSKVTMNAKNCENSQIINQK